MVPIAIVAMEASSGLVGAARPPSSMAAAGRPVGRSLCPAPVRGHTGEVGRVEAELEDVWGADAAPRGWRRVLQAFMVGGDNHTERFGVDEDIPMDDVLLSTPPPTAMYHSALAERLATQGVSSKY